MPDSKVEQITKILEKHNAGMYQAIGGWCGGKLPCSILAEFIVNETRSPIANNGVSLDVITDVLKELLLTPKPVEGKPTIAELQKMLDDPATSSIGVLPDGSIACLRPEISLKELASAIHAKLQPTAPRGGNMIDVVKKAVESGAVVIKPCTANCLNGIITDHEGAEVRDIVCPTCSGREYVITEGEVSGG